MTVDEVEQAAAAFRFVGGLSMWSAKVYVVHEGGLALLKMQIVIPDSTDPSGRTTQVLKTSVEIAKDEPGTPERFVVDALTRFFLHEMFESILVRGDRVFDPHVAGAYHPGAL
jgi:hypothetical protein